MNIRLDRDHIKAQILGVLNGARDQDHAAEMLAMLVQRIAEPILEGMCVLDAGYLIYSVPDDEFDSFGEGFEA